MQLRVPRLAASLLAAALLAACAGVRGPGDNVAVLLLGEQHDAPRHQQVHADVIGRLAARGRLAAVVLEMAEHGGSTERLPPGASEDEVRNALRWKTEAWPWTAYGPAVMAAVRAGAPVLGANLVPQALRDAMRDPGLDTLLPAHVWQAQHRAIRDGHCGALPEAQITPMTRVQIARDRAMAQAITRAAVAGKTVVLLAGSGHVDPEVGVPRHLPTLLPAHWRVKPVLLPREDTGKDYCAQFRERAR